MSSTAIELHTEHLRRELGAAITANVRLHNRAKGNRLVLLQSEDAAKRKTTQSLAFTRLHTKLWDPAIHKIDDLLRSGGLMGETFKAHGYNVQQHRLLRLRLPLLSPRLARLYGYSIWKLAEIECYEFWADAFCYGTVIEVKHPRRIKAPARPTSGSCLLLQRLGSYNIPQLLLRGLSVSYGVIKSIVMYARMHRWLGQLSPSN